MRIQNICVFDPSLTGMSRDTENEHRHVPEMTHQKRLGVQLQLSPVEDVVQGLSPQVPLAVVSAQGFMQINTYSQARHAPPLTQASADSQAQTQGNPFPKPSDKKGNKETKHWKTRYNNTIEGKDQRKLPKR